MNEQVTPEKKENSKSAIGIIGKVISVIFTVFLVLIILFNLANLILRTTSDEVQPRVFGYSTAVVISGSMAPTIDVNDLVIYKEQEKYEVGDVVIFANFGSNSCTTHRIVRETPDGFYTQGDANNTEDKDPKRADQIFGKAVLVIPYVGIVSDIMNQPMGILILVLLGFAIVVIPILTGDKKNPEEEKKEQDLEAEIERLKKLGEEKAESEAEKENQ